LLQIDYPDLFSLFSSDMLDLTEELQILKLLSYGENNNLLKSDGVELLVYPIRFIYIQPGELFKTI